ncbi:UDP-3-O-(3-hydroxymyristoyl)glucosamine N-acyltransferase [Lewinellaceae bacterium SD302]|nr:UDP-3-O-(3-hydroxymyristoyl)glucosamine N-acyltransferase [Lewinellaceae bacterium SD302]
MQISVAKVAELVGGTVDGDSNTLIDRPAKIEEAGPGSISFLGNMRYEPYVYTSRAAALLVPVDFIPRKPYQPALIRVEEVYTAVGQLLSAFNIDPSAGLPASISEKASVDEDAQLGNGVSIGRFSIVEKGTQLGTDTRLMDQVFIGADCKIGKNCLFYPGVRIMHGSVIGDNCVIHSNTVIGGDGFGFAPREDGSYTKVPQVGNVILEADVEIGTNCSVDRATMGSTIIRRGVKLDNLIQIGHNVEIGADTVIASQAGVAGSTKIGPSCKVGGQAGFAGHLTIAAGSSFQAQSGIAGNVKQENGTYFGSPAIDYGNFVRSSVVFKQLPELAKTVARLEKKLKELEK